MTGFLRLELARSFRDPRYLVLAIAAPAGLYLLFAGIFTGRGTSEGQLPAQVEMRGTSGSGIAAVHVVWTARMPRHNPSLVMVDIDAVLR